jgi:hypothetical protein
MTRSTEQDPELFPDPDEPDEGVELDLATGEPLYSSEPEKARSDEELVGLGGWLIVVGIQIVLTAIASVGAIVIHAALVAELSASPDSYPSGLFPILAFEVLCLFAFLVVEIIQCVFFFKKRRLFPKIYIGLSLAYIAWPLLDSGAYWLIDPDEPFFDQDTLKALVQSIGSAVVWIWYMIESKRVANTFVN